MHSSICFAGLPLNETTIVVGYKTGVFGKWHFGVGKYNTTNISTPLDRDLILTW